MSIKKSINGVQNENNKNKKKHLGNKLMKKVELKSENKNEFKGRKKYIKSISLNNQSKQQSSKA
jgi:hypothetical protein